MSSGFYMAAQAMLVQQKRLNTIGNNIANVKTNGFKSENVIVSNFDEKLKLRIDENGRQVIGSNYMRQQVDTIETSHLQGDIRETNRAFDVAIGGEGFFQIVKNNQVYYTRNGSFSLDENNYLSLQGMGQVRGLNGPIRLDNDGFTINAAGQIFDRNNQFIDQILINVPQDYQTMQKQANGLYQNTGGQMQVGMPMLFQGALEASNVDVNRETTSMIEVQRNFQSMANALKTIDQIDAKAVSEIAKI